MFEKKINGRGRPPEDKFQRRYEIFNAVAPKIMEKGASGITMQEAAEAANMSLGGLYHYFESKKDLMLFPLLPEVCQQEFERHHLKFGHLRQTDPERYLDEFIELLVSSVTMLRPALFAALELGAGQAWEVLEESMQVGMRQIVSVAQELYRETQGHDKHLQARAIRRIFLAALLDRTITEDEMRLEVNALLRGQPLRHDKAQARG